MRSVLAIFLVIFFLGCATEELPNPDEECAPCGNTCITMGQAMVAGCAAPTQDFECVFEDGGCVKIGSECNADADCARGGCSGELCVPTEKAGEMVSICSYDPVFECFEFSSCSCNRGTCDWEENEEYRTCVDEKEGAPLEAEMPQ